MKTPEEEWAIIRTSLQGLINKYGEGIGKNDEAQMLLQEVILALTLKVPFLERVSKLDQSFQRFPDFAPINEAAFDLFMVQFLSLEAGELDDYFDSEEWLEIENATIDRGTELLNLIIYLHESEAEEVIPGIDDFLEEFLLVDDDSFQDEHHIYETLIKYREEMNGKLEELFELSRNIPDEDPLKELFLPISLTLREKPLPPTIFQILKVESDQAALHTAYLSALLPFREYLTQQ